MTKEELIKEAKRSQYRYSIIDIFLKANDGHEKMQLKENYVNVRKYG